MKYKLVSKRKRERPDRPLIVPFMYYIAGAIILCGTIFLLKEFFRSEDRQISDIVGIILLMILFSGFTLLYIRVGYKKRKW